MKKLTVLFCVFMCLCSTTLALEMDTEKFMPVDEIKPGMKGIGKTVFEGTKIEDFQIEVLDVVKNANGPKADIIWILCSGGPLEETGVLSGMSGSPVYIDGRLIGAVAYRLGSFPKRPVAGVTPIASMLRIIDGKEGMSSADRSGTSSWASIEQDDSVLGAEGSFLDFLMRGQPDIVPLASEGNPVSLMPIQTPVMMAGFHPKAIKDIAPVMRRFGMIPIQGGGTSSQSESEEITFAPGAVLGVQLVRGDLSAFASGTLTYVHDNKILGFGHPMMGMGSTSLPMSGGRISLLVSSMMASSKYVSPARTMGTLVYDDQYGIMGVVGKEPEFIPMKVLINSQEFNFEIAKHKLFAPTYAFLAAVNTIYSEEKTQGDYTMRTHWELELSHYPTISKDNVFSGTSPSAAASAFASPLLALMQNTFEEVDVESILLEIEFHDKRTNARIDGVRISKDRIRPGDSLDVTVFMTPYLEDTVTKQFQVTVPKDMPEGRALLRLLDASSSESWERSRAPMKARTVNVSHIIRRIREEESNNDIIVEIFNPKLGVTIRDQELPALPLTALSVISSQKQAGGSGFTRGTTFMKERIHTDYVVSGSAMLILDIDRDAP